MNEVGEGEISFGVDAASYSHLPAWNEFMKQRKQIKKLFWVEIFAVSFFTLLIAGNYFEGVFVWWKELLRFLGGSVVAMIFVVLFSYFGFFAKIREQIRK